MRAQQRACCSVRRAVPGEGARWLDSCGAQQARAVLRHCGDPSERHICSNTNRRVAEQQQQKVDSESAPRTMTTWRLLHTTPWPCRMLRMPCTVELFCRLTKRSWRSVASSTFPAPASGCPGLTTSTTSSSWYGVTCKGRATQGL